MSFNLFGNFNNARKSFIYLEIDRAKPPKEDKFAISLKEDIEDNIGSKITMYVALGDLIQIRNGLTRIIEAEEKR